MNYKVTIEDKYEDELDEVLNEAKEEVLKDHVMRYIMQTKPGEYYYSTEKDEKLHMADVMYLDWSSQAISSINLNKKWELEKEQGDI